MLNKSLYALFHSQNATHDDQCLKVYLEIEYSSSLIDYNSLDSVEARKENKMHSIYRNGYKETSKVYKLEPTHEEFFYF